MTKIKLNEQRLKQIISENIKKVLSENYEDETVLQNIGQAYANRVKQLGSRATGAVKTQASAMKNGLQTAGEQAVATKLRAALLAVQAASKASPNNQAYQQCAQQLQGAIQSLNQASKSNIQQVASTAKDAYQQQAQYGQAARANLAQAQKDATNARNRFVGGIKGAANMLAQGYQQGAANVPQV